jgi:hypothetical protein
MFEISYKRDGKLVTETHRTKDVALANFFAITGIGMSNHREIRSIMADLDTNHCASAYIRYKGAYVAKVAANMPMPRVRPAVLRSIGVPPTVHGIQ